MKTLIGGTALALALFLTGCGGEAGGGGSKSGNGAAPAAAVAPPANGDWTQTVVETPEGGFRMGNPNAAVKLVEYASVTCPHCAEFSEEATAPLTEMVKGGQLSWEFRHYLIFPTDPGLSLLSRCQGPGPFFALTEQLYADQKNWSSKVQSLPPAELQRLQAMPPQQQASALVKSAGLDQFFRQRGIPQARIDSCLADQQGLQKLVDLMSRANSEGVTGTPTFFINGDLVPLENRAIWPQLQPVLDKALGR